MQFKPIKFVDVAASDKDFLTELRLRVENYFTKNQLSPKSNTAMKLKSFIVISLYILPFILYIKYNPSLSISLLLWAIMAIGLSGIGMCIMHDANHSAYSHSRFWNEWLGKIINIIGGAAFNWKIQHNILHHTYTNITHYDDDIDDKAILKLSPHTPAKWYHKYQHYYAFIFYAISTLYWSIIKDFLQLHRYTQEGLNKNTKTENLWLWIKIILSKLLYFGILILLPYYVSNIPLGKTILCFLCMHFIGGIILTIVFQLAHTVDGTAHPVPNNSNKIEGNWAIHQMKTTCNFARKNTWISWYVGGLNFQIEHHLFPQVCHIHYPAISPIVEQTAKEFNIPYLEFDTLTQALQAHIRALKNFSHTNIK